MLWQSPISPGVSWYQASAGDRPAYAPLDGSRSADVAVIGGGFTGLQAAYNLAKAGVSVILIDGARFGDGASGRNGGQMGTGQRWLPEEMEEKLGYEAAKRLFGMAEDAKAYLLDFAASHGVDIDFQQGQMNVAHKKGYEKEYRDSVEIAATRYNYPHMHFMDAQETAERVGSKRFYCGIRDTGTGHIHPLKLVIGVAKAAQAAGAALHEMTPAQSIRREGGKVVIATARGTITAERALIACNGYIEALEPVTAAHVMPIGSFIGTTPPLDTYPHIMPGGEAIADSRFVVRYFRKTKDNRLLFGGREAYSRDDPGAVAEHIRKQIVDVYPELAGIEITHSWGGFVAITMPRQPFVREVMAGVTSIGGYSGHGVMLSNYCGKLYADEVCGEKTDLDGVRALKIPSFPGGTRFRSPLLFLAMTWYSLRDLI